MCDVLSKILALLEERGALSVLGNFSKYRGRIECVASDVGMVRA